MTSTTTLVEPRAPDATDLAGLAGLKLGNYRLERLVGRGRMGVVYLAKDEALLRPTAIKVLSWRVAEARGHDPVQWFLAEARVVARINHPRVVQIYGAARHAEYCYIAMEYVAGQSAEAMVAQGRPMPPQLATDVVMQAASALHAAHLSGVVHRDVKPANLLVGEGGLTKLGDFGMALGPVEVRTGSAHIRVGTPYYTAPEIWRGEMAVAASDLYSLGATYFQLLTGRPPYPGHDVAAVEQGHLRGAIPDPRELVPGLPASCAALVMRALAKAPQDRHASAQELVWDARRVIQDLASTEAPGTAGATCPPPVIQLDETEPEPPPLPLPPATGPLAQVLGFAHPPFSTTEPGRLGWCDHPLAGTRARALASLQDERVRVAFLLGVDGSGRTELCQGIGTRLGRSRLVASVTLQRTDEPRAMLQRLCRAAGVLDAATDDRALGGLVDRSLQERARGGSPLLVIDGAGVQHAPTLAKLASAAVATRCFQLVVGTDPAAARELRRAAADLDAASARDIAVPALERGDLAAYFRRWLDATLAPSAPPILVTPDALLLVALRSGGAVERVDCMAENMLLLAATERVRTLSSWHAWAAPDDQRWSARRGAALPRRPEAWPPSEVIDVVDACRRGAGMPPWPRAARSGERDT